MGLLWQVVNLTLEADPHAERRMAELCDLLGERPHLAVGFVVEAMRVMLAIRAGELERAESLAHACASLGTAAGDADATGWHGAHLITIRWYQGRLVELIPMLEHLVHSPTLSAVDQSPLAALAVAAATAGRRVDGVDREHARAERERRRERVEPERDPRDEEDPGDHHGEGDRRAEVGLDHDQGAEDRDDEADGLGKVAERPRDGAPRENRAYPDADRELRELGGLDADRAEEEPAVRAVDRGRGEHGRAETERDDEHQRRERAKDVVVEPREDREKDEADDCVEALLDEEPHRVAFAQRR